MYYKKIRRWANTSSSRYIKNIVVIFIFCLPFPSIVQSQTVQAKQGYRELACISRVWGALKYNHPAVRKGRLDWDEVFVQAVRIHQKNSPRDRMQKAIMYIIGQADGKLFVADTLNVLKDPAIQANINWLAETKLLDESSKKKILSTVSRVHNSDNFYVKTLDAGNTVYSGEKSYDNMLLPNLEYRLLALSRFWNVIEYFFPYKSIIGRDWNLVLDEFVPKFIAAHDTLAYHLCIMELTTRINDSHAYASNKILDNFFGLYSLPIQVKRIKNQFIVTSFLIDSLGRLDGLKVGDLVDSIDGVSLKSICDSISRYIGGSNEGRKNYSLLRHAMRGRAQKAVLSVTRGTSVIHLTMSRYPLGIAFKNDESRSKLPIWSILDGNIGYVDMERLLSNSINITMQDLQGTRAIVFDLRNHPQSDVYLLIEHFFPSENNFALISIPNLEQPGTFKFTLPLKPSPQKFIPQYYSHQIFVLTDERTISSAEFHLMAFKIVPKVTVIGSQTAGTDGNRSFLVLPGGIQTIFSGTGVYYPDGKVVQRIGIAPDVFVAPTILGIQSGRDEVLERALELIRTGR